MDLKVLGIMYVLVSIMVAVFFQYTLNIDFQKANDYLKSNHDNSKVFIETPDTTDFKILIERLNKIEVEPNLSNAKKQEILLLLAELNSREKANLERVKEQLLEKAKETSEERDFIIFHLLENIDYQHFQEIYDNPKKKAVWALSIDILADLEAEEGIKYFVQGLDFMPWVKRSFHNSHTYNAVLKLRGKSVPALIVALRFGRPEIRMGATEALAEIDSELSRKALESALFTEQNDWVKSVIKQNLSYLKRRCEEHNYFQECSNHSWNF